jgi:rhodanese-related sulfurtransferase
VLSPLSARKAEKLGYKNVKVFHAGMPAWKKSGGLVVSNLANLDKLNKIDASYILLDLRSKDQIEKGHIPKAVAAVDGKVAVLKDQLPKYKKAAIILYNQKGDLQAAKDAYKTLAGLGYKQVSILDGGFAGWEKAGKKVAKGPAATKITYVRKLMPGEMNVADFVTPLKKPEKTVVVVDVRNASEFKAGSLPNATNTPLEEIESKLAKLPKDKTLVVFCNTGVRAEMAYDLLKKAGLKSKYVKASIKFDKDKKGKYTIE